MSSAEHSSEPGARYNGWAAWGDETLRGCFRHRITEAVFRGESILIDWPEADGAKAHTHLERKEGENFVGQSVWAAKTAKEDTADVEAVLYSNTGGHVLIGEEKWRRSGTVDWFVVRFYTGQTGERDVR